MKAFDESKKEREDALFLKLMNGVAENPYISQRALANDLEIAFGLANSYIKRCVNKGWLRVKQIPARRYAYYLTPNGFQEKSRLASNYLQGSFQFFRIAKQQCEEILQQCLMAGQSHIVLVGKSELSEILSLVAEKNYFQIMCCDVCEITKHNKADAFIITDTAKPQESFEQTQKVLGNGKSIYTPVMLHISRVNPVDDGEV